MTTHLGLADAQFDSPRALEFVGEGHVDDVVLALQTGVAAHLSGDASAAARVSSAYGDEAVKSVTSGTSSESRSAAVPAVPAATTPPASAAQRMSAAFVEFVAMSKRT